MKYRESLDRFDLVHGLDSCLDLEFDMNLWSLRKKAYLEFGGLYLLDMELQ